MDTEITGKEPVTMKKVLLIITLLTAAMIGCSSCTRSTEDYEIVTLKDGTELFRYTDMDYYVIRSLKNCTSTVYVVPDANVNGYRITEMWETAVIGNSTIRTMIFQDNIESFSFDLYYEFSSLESIFIGAGVRKVWSGTFAKCPNLKQVTVDVRNAVYRSENNAVIEKSTDRLVAASAATVVIPDSVRIIGSNAFDYSRCESMIIPENVVSIEKCAFQKCAELRTVFIPASVEKIAGFAFRETGGTTFYCEAAEKPDGWNDDWCGDAADKIIWGADAGAIGGKTS